MIRELAKRLTSPSRAHLTMLSKGMSRTHSPFRPHISHSFNNYAIRCFALKAVSSATASELTLETASLNAISASKKATTKKKKLDSVNILLNPNSVPAPELTLETASLNAISASEKKKTTTRKKKIDSVNTLLTPNSVSDVQIDQVPVYSYKQCKPLPTVVYTQHEEEADELIAGLKAGYVLSITKIKNSFSFIFFT
jgi:hypothetical protein